MRSSLFVAAGFVVVAGALSSLVACSGDSEGDNSSSSSGGNATSSSGGSSGENGSSSGGSSSSSSGASGSSSGGSSSGGSSSGGLDPNGSSQGTGGIECESEASIGGGLDRQYCLAHEGGSEFRFVMPDQPSDEPYTLALYLHGDGAGAHRSGSATRYMLPFTDEHNAIMVSVLAPNGCAWWLKPDYTCPTEPQDGTDADRDREHANATALDAVMRKFRERYDIRNGTYYFYGASGGSFFLTNSFFPKFGDKYPGAYAIICGGEAPYEGAVSWDMNDAAKRGSTQLWFTYGALDEYREHIDSSLAFYQSTPVPVINNAVPDTKHCRSYSDGSVGLNGHQSALDVWNAYPQQ